MDNFRPGPLRARLLPRAEFGVKGKDTPSFFARAIDTWIQEAYITYITKEIRERNEEKC